MAKVLAFSAKIEHPSPRPLLRPTRGEGVRGVFPRNFNLSGGAPHAAAAATATAAAAAAGCGVHFGLMKFSQILLAAFSPRPSRLIKSRKVWMGEVTLTCSKSSAPRNTPSSYGTQRLTLPFPFVSVRSRAEMILLRSDAA